MSSPVADHWRLRTRTLPLRHTVIVGVVNVTPDSFSDGGQFVELGAAVEHARRLAAAGADLIDVGGESTRPGAAEVSAAEERRRVVPVVKALATEGVAVSIDTSKAAVARSALEAGAEVVNDVTALADPAMVEAVASSGAGLVLMHMQGTPRTMQIDPYYRDVVAEVVDFLVAKARLAESAGIAPDRICLDPGIGFGKNLDHNLELLRSLGVLAATGYPVMVGTSRKSFLGRLTGLEEPSDRDLATAVTVALAVERGARVVRVHEVSGARQAALVAEAIVPRPDAGGSERANRPETQRFHMGDRRTAGGL